MACQGTCPWLRGEHGLPGDMPMAQGQGWLARGHAHGARLGPGARLVPGARLGPGAWPAPARQGTGASPVPWPAEDASEGTGARPTWRAAPYTRGTLYSPHMASAPLRPCDGRGWRGEGGGGGCTHGRKQPRRGARGEHRGVAGPIPGPPPFKSPIPDPSQAQPGLASSSPHPPTKASTSTHPMDSSPWCALHCLAASHTCKHPAACPWC